MKITDTTKIHDLLNSYPFLEDFLVAYHPKFEMLKNKMARATIGRVATLRTAAGIANIDIGALLGAVAAEIEKHTGEAPEVVKPADGSGQDRRERVEILKGIIQNLHDGGDLNEARKRFAEAVHDVDATEIAAMEEELIRGGLPVSEVQRLCDVHVGTFKPALDGHTEPQGPAGHPVHTYMAANRVITELADTLGDLAQKIARGENVDQNMSRAGDVLQRLEGVDNHYQRKENQLFPVLERHGVTGPSQVMWGVHDQIRAAFKKTRESIAQKDAAAFGASVPGLARDLVEMVYKEEKILFPMCLQMLSEEEWAEIRRGEDDLGYVIAQPAASWPHGAPAEPTAEIKPAGLLALVTGELSLDQVNLIYSHLPVDLSFVDENDVVRFYSEGPQRLFPRSPAVIGRKVQKCHPPKSVQMVEEILQAFRAGKQNVAEFWIETQGKFIFIQYAAVRDKDGTYRGCLEISQDATRIRALEGERRLLQWASDS